MKIQIIGYSGSGKSNLAWRLATHYNIPCLHLDGVQFYGNWDIRDDDEQNNIVRDFLAKNDSWVIDGNYSRIAPERFTQSDITIFLNYNRFYCYRKARQRAIENRGKIRYSCPCPEKFDREFQRWILWDSRIAHCRKRHKINLNRTNGQKLMFRNLRQLNKWLKSNNIEHRMLYDANLEK